MKKGKNFDKIRFMERETWYNKKIPIKYIFIAFILIFSSSIFLPRPELSCSKANNICNYYFVNFRGEKEIEQTFKISDIDTYEITSNTGGRGGMTTYTSIIYLKVKKLNYILKHTALQEQTILSKISSLLIIIKLKDLFGKTYLEDIKPNQLLLLQGSYFLTSYLQLVEPFLLKNMNQLAKYNNRPSF